MRLRRAFSLSLITLAISLVLAPAALAATAAECSGFKPGTVMGSLLRVACRAGFVSANSPLPSSPVYLVTILGHFINIALSFIGVIFVVLLIYGGWLWGSSRGNEDQVRQAHDLIRDSIIGIIVIFSAFVISNFIINQVLSFALTTAP